MDQLPSEIISNVFKYVPTIDLGRLMQVCSGFHRLLSNDASLWRHVELETITPKGSALKIIQIFASRSNHTLVSIKTPETLEDEKQTQLVQLLEKSKSSLRRLDIHLATKSIPEGPNEPPVRFLSTFPVIERLNLSRSPLPEVEEQIPGVLSVLASAQFFSEDPWSAEDDPWSAEEFKRISNLQILHVPDNDDRNIPVPQVIQACSSTLKVLSLGYFDPDHPVRLDFDLPVLSTLILETNTNLLLGALPNLRYVLGTPMTLIPYDFKNLHGIEFLANWLGFHDVQEIIDSLEGMIKMCRDSSVNLTWLKLKEDVLEEVSLDALLRALKVDYLPPLCPHLSDLYIGIQQNLEMSLLAEVAISRNFASKGWKFSQDEDAEEEGSCSELTLHLNPSQIEDFKVAESSLLSNCLIWMREQAGRTKVRAWDE